MSCHAIDAERPRTEPKLLMYFYANLSTAQKLDHTVSTSSWPETVRSSLTQFSRKDYFS